jgi:hypothetical protein
MRKLLGLLLALAACQAHRPAVVPVATPAALPAQPWATTIADRLYARQVLSAAGRDDLKRRIAAGQLAATYLLPGSGNTFADKEVDPATVLTFCAQAFQAELLYRLEPSARGKELLGSPDLYIAGQALDTAAIRTQQQKMTAALQQVHGDTAALWRQLASPGQLLEERIPAEDSLITRGWTIYPPLGRVDSVLPRIAESRSVFGKTRTRTARDLYELGLATRPHYELLRQELASGQLSAEGEVCQRAAQLALEAVSYPTRRLAFDSVLTRLAQAGVLPAAAYERALADSALLKQLKLFDLLPYCRHAKVLELPTLPRSPRLFYPRLLAEVAAVWPAFHYTAVRVSLTEHAEKYTAYVEQRVALAFTANGRQYASTFQQGYRSDERRRVADVSEDFALLINQWLRDQGAPQRLYLAYTPDAESVYGHERQGFLLLTPQQRAAWGLAAYFLSPTPADTRFTSGYIEKALSLYQRLGLFAKLTPRELAAGRRQALRGEVSSYVGLLRCFPRLVAETGGEDAEEPRAYAKALAQVAACTRGAFQPTRIHDSFSGEQGRQQLSRLSFTCRSRQYKATLTSSLGWMDFGFTKLVERAVRENTNGRLYYLGEGDETGAYVFLTAAQAAMLHKAQPGFFTEAAQKAE